MERETTESSGARAGPMGGIARGHVALMVSAVAVVAIAAVVWFLPPRRDSSVADAPAENQVMVSTLVNRGYVSMGQRSTEPAALDRALADFEQAHAIDPTHLDARFALAWARQVKELPESEWRELYEETIREALLLTFLSRYNLGYAERQAGRYAEAVALLEQAVLLMPERADGWSELGRAREAVGQVDAAAEAFRRAAELQR